jgi:hypothetical protein
MVRLHVSVHTMPAASLRALLAHSIDYAGMFPPCSLDVLNIAELQNVARERRPDFADIIYWIPYLAWPIIGALLVYIYIVTKIEVNALFAFQTGLAAPLILKSLSNVIPKHPIDPGAGA